MARAREKLPQIGFWDAEVALPKHDDICTWIYENASVRNDLKGTGIRLYDLPYDIEKALLRAPFYCSRFRLKALRL